MMIYLGREKRIENPEQECPGYKNVVGDENFSSPTINNFTSKASSSLWL
jgi:hypothetical protein